MDIIHNLKNGVLFLNFVTEYFDFKKIVDLNDTIHELSNILHSNEDKVVIDFKGIDYIGSSGIGLLLMLKSKIEEVNGLLALTNVNEKIANVMNILQLDQFFSIINDEEKLSSFFSSK